VDCGKNLPPSLVVSWKSALTGKCGLDLLAVAAGALDRDQLVSVIAMIISLLGVFLLFLSKIPELSYSCLNTT